MGFNFFDKKIPPKIPIKRENFRTDYLYSLEIELNLQQKN